ncbi:hypothetical protein J6590_075189 [Homalodisca vitripennis]|nr:hypothetical protein J6590_075189 [Homalodisca vitripennis]
MESSPHYHLQVLSCTEDCSSLTISPLFEDKGYSGGMWRPHLTTTCNEGCEFKMPHVESVNACTYHTNCA